MNLFNKQPKVHRTIESVIEEMLTSCRDWTSRFYTHLANGDAIFYHPFTKTFGVAEMHDMLTPIDKSRDIMVYNGVQLWTVVDGLTQEELLDYCDTHNITTIPRKKSFKDILANFI